MIYKILAIADIAAAAGTCTRVYQAGPDFPGYQIRFIPERDGEISQSGDIITVIKERPTPVWCNDPTIRAPEAGWTGDFKDYYHGVGLHKLACLGWTRKSHSDTTCSIWSCETLSNPDLEKVFSYDALAQAAGYFPDFAGYATYEQSVLDFASFIAHSTKETMGDNPIWDNAWCFTNEVGTTSSGSCAYGCAGQAANQESCTSIWGKMGGPNTATTVPPEYSHGGTESWNKGYWGRGSIQLSYCYNYGFFGNWVSQEMGIPRIPETDFYNNPGFVATKDWSFAAGIWFYMSPSSDGIKPSMHSIVDFWVDAKSMVVDSIGRPSDIGYQVNILNGGVECGGSDTAYAQKRLDSLNAIMGRLNYPGAVSGSYLHMPFLQINGCKNVNNLTTPHGYWDINGLHCSGDTINSCTDDDKCGLDDAAVNAIRNNYPVVPMDDLPGSMDDSQGPMDDLPGSGAYSWARQNSAFFYLL